MVRSRAGSWLGKTGFGWGGRWRAGVAGGSAASVEEQAQAQERVPRPSAAPLPAAPRTHCNRRCRPSRPACRGRAPRPPRPARPGWVPPWAEAQCQASDSRRSWHGHWNFDHVCWHTGAPACGGFSAKLCPSNRDADLPAEEVAGSREVWCILRICDWLGEAFQQLQETQGVWELLQVCLPCRGQGREHRHFSVWQAGGVGGRGAVAKLRRLAHTPATEPSS